MKAFKVSLAGQDYYLTYNGAAMFEVEDDFGGVSQLMSAVQQNGREGFENLCQGLAILAEQGELARRVLGYDPGPIPGAETFRTLIQPTEVPAMQLALNTAILAGYGREVEQNEDVDLGLLELEQKKTKG